MDLIFYRRKNSFASMACEDIDHISERWLSSEDIVLMSSGSDETSSRTSLDTPSTISDDEMEEFKIEPVHTQSGTSKPLLQREDTISKEHWKNKKDIKECPGCGKSMSLLQSKHHCRSCGGVFCYYCTRFCRRLSSQRGLDPEGKKYKVCKNCENTFCAISSEGQTRSWTNEFHTLSDEKESRFLSDKSISEDTIKRLSEDTDSRGILRCTSVRGRLLDVYQDDITKATTDKLLEKGKKAARGNLFYLFKTTTKDENRSDEPAICFDCKTNLNIEGFRKLCKVCDKTFCIDCCDKDVVLTSRNSQRVDKEEPVIIFGYKKNSTEHDKMKKKERYRVCRFCKSQYLNENFLRDVSNIARHLIQLQKKITTAEDDCKELPTFQMDYMQSYGDLCKIIAHSSTQRRLKQNVVNATRDFYFERLRSDSWRKSNPRRESTGYDKPDSTEETESGSTEAAKPKEGHTTESFFDMRALFRRSKPQENASDYIPKVGSKPNSEEKQVTFTTFEQSNEWVNITVDKKREQKVAKT